MYSSTKIDLSTNLGSNSNNENSTINNNSQSFDKQDKDLENAKIYYERLQRAKDFPIPTNDKEVKIMLRELCEPIIYFGESKADRRERLQIKVKECILLGMNIKHPLLKEEFDPAAVQVMRELKQVKNWVGVPQARIPFLVNIQ